MYPATASEQMYAERAGFCSLRFLLNVLNILNPFFTSYTPCITMYYLLDRPAANRLPAGSRLRKKQHFHAFPDFCSNQLLHRLQEFHRIPQCRGSRVPRFRRSSVPRFHKCVQPLRISNWLIVHRDTVSYVDHLNYRGLGVLVPKPLRFGFRVSLLSIYRYIQHAVVTIVIFLFIVF